MIKIYALVEGNLILYVGKTTQDLKEREWKHRSISNTSHSRYIPKHCKWEIVEIGEYPDDEGTLWEQFWYDTLDPLYNKCRPGQTHAEYEQTENGKKRQAKASRKHNQTEKRKKLKAEYRRKYYLRMKELTAQQP